MNAEPRETGMLLELREWAIYCFQEHGNDAHLYNGLAKLAGMEPWGVPQETTIMENSQGEPSAGVQPADTTKSPPFADSSYVAKHEAKRIIEAIEPAAGATMTLMCALREAWQAGRDGKELVW